MRLAKTSQNSKALSLAMICTTNARLTVIRIIFTLMLKRLKVLNAIFKEEI